MPHSAKLPAIKRSALQIALIYVVASVTWITVSDVGVRYLAESKEQMSVLNIIKGYLFIGITALVLCLMINRLLRRISLQQEEYRQQSELLQALFHAAPVAIYLLDLDGRVTLWNAGAEKIFGWSAGEAVGAPLPTVPAEKRDEHTRILERIKEGHAFHEMETSRIRKDGNSIDISLSTAPLLDRDRRISGCIFIASDVTTRKQAETEITRLTRFYSLILDTIRTGVWVSDGNDIITYVNHGLETIEGLPSDRIVGKSIVQDLPETNYGGIRAIYRQTREEREPTFYEAEPVTSPAGRTTYRSGWLVPLFSGDRFDGMICTVEDITERRIAEKESCRYQEQLRVMNSMRALDEEFQRHNLSMSLHDGIGQLLAMARIKLSTLQASLSHHGIAPLTELQATLDEAISATRSLTVEISPPILYQLGLEAALEGLVETFRNRHGLPVTYREEGIPRQLNKETSIFLYQSSRELLINALKHANASTVVVTCVRQEDTIVITVTDDGVGFPPPGPGRIPDSYGLFSIAERMRHIGGTLSVSSAPHQGSKIELIAPIPAP